jgi:hypothetical protein
MIQTPQNQQRLTNVAIVKLKKGGKQFEVINLNITTTPAAWI